MVTNIFESEYRNMTRIYTDSQRLAQSTKNLKVFVRRIEVIRECIRWCFQMKAAGLPITLNMDILAANEDVDRFVNRNCVRIAKAWSKDAKTPRTIASALKKMDELIPVLHPAKNLKECEKEVLDIRAKLEAKLAKLAKVKK